jgi:toxin ParE1/3/4
MAQVRWSLTAGNDLQDIEDFIARDSVLHAITFVDRIIETAEILLKNTHLGPSGTGVQSPRSSRSSAQGVPRIVYLLQNDEVFILRVVHGARNLPALVSREPWDISS